MAFVPPAWFGTIPWAEREGDDQGDPSAAFLEIRPGELDTVTTALRRLWFQWRSTTSWPLLLGMLGDLWADLELGLGSVDQSRYISTAEGDVLDEIGALVNLGRGGLSDDLYRLAIRARAASLFTGGTIPELVEITSALLGRILVTEWFPAAFSVQALDVPTDVFLLMLEILSAFPVAGVAAILINWNTAETAGWGTSYSTMQPSPVGSWSSSYGADADDALSLWSTGAPIGE